MQPLSSPAAKALIFAKSWLTVALTSSIVPRLPLKLVFSPDQFSFSNFSKLHDHNAFYFQDSAVTLCADICFRGGFLNSSVQGICCAVLRCIVQ